ncbi:hypothetical protein DFH06DRAFT_1119398 [Mycena polygramma]|nr:hypothetical protein DFH06DRAFT_1119398 [Mycena polygramma]
MLELSKIGASDRLASFTLPETPSLCRPALIYNSQVYDDTRENITHGRESMLSLCAAHLRVLRAASPGQRLVWVDVGGGTGQNIEIMQQYYPISNFDAIYIVDRHTSLLDEARRRVAKNGWTNVEVVCQDAQYFQLPEWSNGIQPEGSIGFATLAYCLSAVIDYLDQALYIPNGLVGVIDFYTHDKPHAWLNDLLWHFIRFAPHRRTYLNYKFELVGNFMKYITSHRYFQMPYYIWVGRPRFRKVSEIAGEFEDMDQESRNVPVPTAPAPPLDESQMKSNFPLES